MAFRAGLSASRLAVRRAGAVRGLASGEHEPPLKLFGIPARYANATFVAASKAGTLPKVETELLAFQALLEKNAKIKAYLTSPVTARDDKVATIDKLFGGPKAPTFGSKNLFTVMAANGRVSEVDKVVEAFVALMKAKRKEVSVDITSAEALTKAQTDKIAESLKGMLGGGSASISTTVDPSILGGLTVKIGDKFLDLSVKSKVDAVSRSLATA